MEQNSKIDLEKFTIYGWVELDGILPKKDEDGNVLLYILKRPRKEGGRKFKKVFLKTLHLGRSKNKMKNF